MKKETRLQLDLEVLLPEVRRETDACVGRLIAELSGRSGVDKAHVVEGGKDAPARLCIHYDPQVLSLSRVRAVVTAAGAQIANRFGHLLWSVEGLRHERRARTVSERLSAIVGVIEAEATSAGLVRIEFDRNLISEHDLLDALREMGVQRNEPTADASTHDATFEKALGMTAAEETHDHEHGNALLGENTELYFALLSGGALGIGYLLSKMTAAPGWVPLVCYVAAYAFGGFFTLREAIDSLRLRRFEIDTLMLVAAAGAAALGEWAEGALLLFLFSIGHALEHYALGRARRAIEALGKLAPPTAEVRRDGRVSEVPVAQLVVGDVVVVRPNSRIPADGFIISGTSSVDQAPVTGESVPVDKRPVDDGARAAAQPESIGADHRVYAGTINGAGALEIQTTRLASDTTLARVVRMVSEAETQKSPTQRFTDRFERAFVPAVLVLVSVLMFAWVVVDERFQESFYRAMAVLVAASPCALAIATPSAVLAAVARAARGGVLVKGGGPLENLGTLGAIAFDKTGTLTEGKPKMTDVVTAIGASEQELLAIAVAVESLSDHPLASAVVRDGRSRLSGAPTPTAEGVRSIVGKGIAATVNGTEAVIGKADLFAAIEGPALPADVKDAATRLSENGRTLMIVRHGDRYLGVLGLMDTPRAPAKDVVKRLRELGITRMIMISGDHKRVAETIAEEIGIDEAWGDLMPEDKVEAIKKLQAQQKVAMVGDGVNDAPAMANATVGIAMGAAGSDVALETADVALMADDLRTLPFAVGLSRRTSSVIRQNWWLSLGMVAFLIPATIFGLQIGIAVLFHEGSTLVVVANALRLLGYRDSHRASLEESAIRT